MSTQNDLSLQLGSYLLRGWTLLDEVCSECLTPLVRSPAPDRRFHCVKCNRDMTVLLPSSVSPSPSAGPNGTLPPSDYRPVVNGDEMDSDEEENEGGIMVDDPPARAPQPNANELSRREQSDRASKLIGEKLLQGYCLLDEICPTSTCYGVPLLRLPRETERRLCVICQKIYPEVLRSAPASASTVVLPLATPITLPPIQTIESSIPTSMPLASSIQNSNDTTSSLLLARENLAREFLRITVLLGTREPHASDYGELLNRAQKMSEIIQNLKG